MGTVQATLKVMPADAERDLDDLHDHLEEDHLDEEFEDGEADVVQTDTEEVAFGLSALLLVLHVPDGEGGTSTVEDCLADCDDVESVSTEQVTRI